MIKQRVIFLFIIMTFQTMSSQYILKNTEDVKWYNSIPQENAIVIPSLSLMMPGEVVYYNFHCFNSDTRQYSNNSKIGYVELVGQHGTVFKHRIKLVGGVGGSDFVIPTSVESGNYKLIGYTQWMKNGLDDHFFQRDLVIINPYEINANTDAIGSMENNFDVALSETKKNDSIISLKADALSYTKRSKVSINVELLGNGFGHYSLRAVKNNGLNKPRNNTLISNKSSGPKNKSMQIGASVLLPEFSGEMIVGIVRDKITQSPIKGKKVLLSLLSKSEHQDITETNNNGVFYFQVKNNYSHPKAMLQVLGQNRMNYVIDLNTEKSINYDVLDFKEFHLSEEDKTMILGRSVHNQIQNSFAKVKQDTIQLSKDSQPFFGNPPLVFELDDYKRFPTFSETIVEVIDQVWTKQGENKSRRIDVAAREFDPYYGKDIDPMIIVDGAFIQDHQSVLDFDASKIKTVRVHREEYYYGDIVYQGIVRIETFNNDFLDNLSGDFIRVFNMFSHQPMKLYYQQAYSEKLINKNKIPDFREQLLWIPDFNFTKKVMKMEFFTSDVEGEFEVILEGFTNLGQYVHEKINIYVK